MLFYNHKQEFIGIDEEGLKLLNYEKFEDLLGVCNDVADLFAKEPGYIHNFKSFGWIDFLLHADSDARSAIVHGNGRTFSCTLQVKNLFLAAEPSQAGYVIDMLHVQSLGTDEIKPHPVIPKARVETVSPVFEQPVPSKSTPSVLPNYEHIVPTPLSEPGVLDVPSYNEPEIADEAIEDFYAKLSLPLSDDELDKDFTPEPPLAIEPVIEPEPAPKVDRPIVKDNRYSDAEQAFINELTVDKSYRFDPNVAASELGLPVDLIQEFIGDFIQQAYEFKEELFEAVMRGDMNNLKILSHKLKGVAANLRIEDAFESLTIINTSNDPVEIGANLKYFYAVVEKLEGKEPTQIDEIPSATHDLSPEIEPSTPSDDEIYTFTPKESAPFILDEDTFEETVSKKDDDLIDLSDEEPFKEEPLLVEEIAIDDNSEAEPIRSLHYDKISVSGQLGIDVDFFNELIDEYKHDALRAGNEIGAAIGAFDTHAWKKTATELKGISDNLRLIEISDELAILSQTNDAQEAHKASKRLNSLLEQL